MKQFKSEDQFREWKLDYQLVFETPAGQKILHDLMEWSGFLDDATESDPFRCGVREGRRQAVLRILRNVHLDIEQLFQVYGGRTVRLTEPAE